MRKRLSSKNLFVFPLIIYIVFICTSCSVIEAPFTITKTALTATYEITKLAAKGAVGTGKIVYKVGEYTFKVAKAPIEWPLTHKEIDSINGMPPKKAIKQNKVKNSPYVVNGKKYIPMSLKEAKKYRQVGIASWYGNETKRKKGGHMTANGEIFDPEQLTAAHKFLPLPCYVKVTNLENKQSIIVRVNDRGPFVPGRIIDLSVGAAKRLGFYEQGTAGVLVETVQTTSG